MAYVAPAKEPAFPAMAPPGVEELTEEQQDKQNALKAAAADFLEDGAEDLALEKFTEAIVLGCASALLYSKRAQVLFDMKRPRAAVNDCNAALAINPDSAKAFKIRARANQSLGSWDLAHSDYQNALKIDYDEDTYKDSAQAAEKAKEQRAAEASKRMSEENEAYYNKLEQNRVAYEANMAQREAELRAERMAQEKAEKAAEAERRARVRQREEEAAAAHAEMYEEPPEKKPCPSPPPASEADQPEPEPLEVD
eukprot:TRINITY_DN75783_c0_g1_i1.p1 TRINITY_DN75783_c0_g1~~TRINITY_DN75783_c0_g1_i1.p1  ORF type:complete len:292 (-),score=90.77 TRINITY_DN75783_c0_g1_i1:248-1006(-)